MKDYEAMWKQLRHELLSKGYDVRFKDAASFYYREIYDITKNIEKFNQEEKS